MNILPVRLEGSHVRLEPLKLDHLDALCAVGLDAELWRWTTVNISTRDDMRRYVEAALEWQRAGTALPYATVLQSENRVIGTTRFANLDKAHRRAEIGWTFIAKPWQRSAANTEAKYLMLQHAFERLGCIRVEFKTDALNAASRKAIARIGAKEEGTLRSHMIAETGRVRDSVYFSIIESEWPAVKSDLEKEAGLSMPLDLAAWQPYARVMHDYFAGKRDATMVIYDDFERDEAPISYFFREPAAFSPIDRDAVELCRGRVLDVGAGSGCLSLALQERGIEVVALEILPELLDILEARGVKQIRRGSIFDFEGERFDTILMMMNGIGLGETLKGLEALLARARGLLAPGGQLLADSCDLRLWEAAGKPDDDHLFLDDGRYLGELHIQLEYQGKKGPPFQQLYVDPDTLEKVAGKAGWKSEVIATIDPGYLARLTPTTPADRNADRR